MLCYRFSVKWAVGYAEKDLSDYLSKLACEMIDNKQTKPFVGTAYITDTDIDSVIDKSDFIFKIKVGEEVFKGVADDRHTFDCTVISSLKGSATKDEIARIVFPMGTVEEGKEYIVALTELPDCSPRTFVMSSKNSIYELSSQEYIEARLSLNWQWQYANAVRSLSAKIFRDTIIKEENMKKL